MDHFRYTMQHVINANLKSSLTVDGKSGKVLPTPKCIKLNTIDAVRVEMASVYRSMKSGTIECSDGTKLAYVLNAIAKAIELHDIEKRIELLESNDNRSQTKLTSYVNDD
jgi:hypothetical protein